MIKFVILVISMVLLVGCSDENVEELHVNLSEPIEISALESDINYGVDLSISIEEMTSEITFTDTMITDSTGEMETAPKNFTIRIENKGIMVDNISIEYMITDAKKFSEDVNIGVLLPTVYQTITRDLDVGELNTGEVFEKVIKSSSITQHKEVSIARVLVNGVEYLNRIELMQSIGN